ncbi:unnamed protein product, partial [marine sediment metagenome]
RVRNRSETRITAEAKIIINTINNNLNTLCEIFTFLILDLASDKINKVKDLVFFSSIYKLFRY